MWLTIITTAAGTLKMMDLIYEDFLSHMEFHVNATWAAWRKSANIEMEQYIHVTNMIQHVQTIFRLRQKHMTIVTKKQ